VARRQARAGRRVCKLDDESYVFSASPDSSTPLKPRSLSRRYRHMARRPKLRSTRLHGASATDLAVCSPATAGSSARALNH
jgi:hypothetical protein